MHLYCAQEKHGLGPTKRPAGTIEIQHYKIRQKTF